MALHEKGFSRRAACAWLVSDGSDGAILHLGFLLAVSFVEKRKLSHVRGHRRLIGLVIISGDEFSLILDA